LSYCLAKGLSVCARAFEKSWLVASNMLINVNCEFVIDVNYADGG
jgi:hypothetical protein